MTLEVKDVFKSFGGKKVLVGLNCRFSEGVNAVTGPSGCGKTTLLRIIAGLEKADAGEVLFDGKTTRPPVSFVFAEPRLFQWLNAADNAACVSSSGMKAGREKAAEYLSALGLGEALRLMPSELSAGMAQRVQLVRAVISLDEGGNLLLLDEPFRGLDPASKERAAEFILSHTAGKTVVCITHDEEDITLLKAVSELSMQIYTAV